MNTDAILNQFTRLFSPFALLVLAVSGGSDSMALMGLIAAWRDHHGTKVKTAHDDALPRLAVATVDHGLREGSMAEARFVMREAELFGFAHALLSHRGSRPLSRIQEEARLIRYRLLADYAQGLLGDMGEANKLHINKPHTGKPHTGKPHACAIVTAHTQDDQAETVLMRLAHGSSPLGLSGMVPRATLAFCGFPDIALVRPLLSCSKSVLRGWCKAAQIPHVEDPSNHNPQFARVRWRALIPALDREGLSTERLAAFAKEMASVEEALQFYARKLVDDMVFAREDGYVVMPVVLWQGMPFEVQLRALALVLSDLGAPSCRRERLKAAITRMNAAWAARMPLTLTLADHVISQSKTGEIVVKRAPGRRMKRRG